MKSLDRKNAIVTGAIRGIGREIANQLAMEGANLVLHYNSGADAATEFAEALKTYNTKVKFIQADFASGVDAVNSFYKQAQSFFNNKIDILINNAGVCFETPIATITEAEFDLHFNVNVKAAYFLCKNALADMKDGGRIINFSGGFSKLPCMANYSCFLGNRGAMEQITKALAFEAAAQGVTINAIAPGATDTEGCRAVLDLEARNKLATGIAMGRLGTPSDIAKFILLTLSEKASWLTGQTVHVNGGWV
jgi:3-oxoacyl-[acyl-carrier protein] reductase